MDAKLTVDGKDIEMNQFVKGFICNTVYGMISSLRGIKNPDIIVIEIKCD